MKSYFIQDWFFTEKTLSMKVTAPGDTRRAADQFIAVIRCTKWRSTIKSNTIKMSDNALSDLEKTSFN